MKCVSPTNVDISVLLIRSFVNNHTTYRKLSKIKPPPGFADIEGKDHAVSKICASRQFLDIVMSALHVTVDSHINSYLSITANTI